MKNCPHCNGEVRDSVIRCVHCGQDVKAPVGSVPQQTVVVPTIPPAGAMPFGPPTPADPPSAEAPAVASGVAPSAVADQPQYFAMKTDLSPPGGLQPGYGASPSSGGDPAKTVFITGILGLLGAAIAGVGLFQMALMVATASGTIDLGAASGGPQQIPASSLDLKFGDWEGLVKTLLIISVIVAAVFAFMVLTDPTIKAVSRLLGEGVLMTALSAWLFTLLPGFKEELLTAWHTLMDVFGSQVPADQYETFVAQADALVSIETGIGFWMIAVGSLIVLAGGVVGAMAVKRAEASSKL